MQIEVNGVRYEAIEDDPIMGFSECVLCDYKKDHNPCYAFCFEMELSNYHFKRLKNEKDENRNIPKQ